MRKTEIQNRIAALRAKLEGLFAKLEVEGTDLIALEAEIKNENTALERAMQELAALEAIEAQVRSRAAAQPALSAARVEPNGARRPWNGLGEFLMAVREAEVSEFRRVDERLASGLSEATGSEGGFAIGTDMSSRLIEQVFEAGAITSRCSDITISGASNSVELPAIDDKNRTDGNRWGGVSAYWASEGATLTATTPRPLQKIKLGLDKLVALVYMTDEMLADQSVMQSWVNRVVPQEMAFKVEDAIVRATGVGLPLGILNSGALITQAAEGSQTADTVNVNNIVKMYSRMPARLKPGAAWFINSEVMPQLQLMTSATTSASQMVYMPPGGVSQAPYGTIFGRPVIEIEQCSALGDVGDIMFCNFGEYLLARKGGVVADSSIHVKFLTDETAFRFRMRIDGKPAWTSTMTPFKGSNTQSPFVVLAAR